VGFSLYFMNGMTSVFPAWSVMVVDVAVVIVEVEGEG
jgi:hypothetical protein